MDSMHERDGKEASREPVPHDDRPLVRGDAEAAAAAAICTPWTSTRATGGAGASDRWGDDDEIVFCDGCDVQVHPSCYGLARPEGQVAVPGVRGRRAPRRRGGGGGRDVRSVSPARRRSGGFGPPVALGRGVGDPGHARARLVRVLPSRGVRVEGCPRSRDAGRGDRHELRQGAAHQLDVLAVRAGGRHVRASASVSRRPPALREAPGLKRSGTPRGRAPPRPARRTRASAGGRSDARRRWVPAA